MKNPAMNWRVCLWMCVWVLVCVVRCGSVWAQGNGATDETVVTTVVVRGRVVNKVTGEGIGRALVTTVGDEYAVMTDDRGQFEMKIVERMPKGMPAGIVGSVAGAVPILPGGRMGVGGMVSVGGVGMRTLQARKPGYLPERNVGSRVSSKEAGQWETTIYLLPEALIVGRVNVPGTEGEVRIECELYRRRMEEGKETWQAAGTFTTWANGEFRFSGLEAGTYRLITHEQMDRDSMVARPGAELFGYPPIYYPNTTDFSVATTITVKAGETAQANLTVARHAYYPVRIPVGNAPAAGGMNVLVHPMGHWGPGWSLGYNPGEQAIEGMLPDGNYTVELDSFGENGSTGIGNFVVSGGPFEGAPVRMVGNTSVTVNVREEFQHNNGGDEREVGMRNGRPSNITVMLRDVAPEESRGSGRGAQARPMEGTDSRTLILENVQPGRYRVTVYAGNGYVAAMESGGVDLLKQPLVVGMGGAVPPVEITLRDDGAEVSGTVEAAAGANAEAGENGDAQRLYVVYLVPMGHEGWQQPQVAMAFNGAFQVPNVPPGEYLALAYENAQPEQDIPPFGDEEFLKRVEEMGQRIQVEAGEKVNVNLKVIAGGEKE
jgi:hypothetical protein